MPNSTSAEHPTDPFTAVANLALEIQALRESQIRADQRFEQNDKRFLQLFEILDSRETILQADRGIAGHAPLLNRGPAPPRALPLNTHVTDDFQDIDRPPPADRGPRLRLDAPKFNGTDAEGWIFQVQSYFDFYQTRDEDRIRLVGMLFEHPASEWFRYQRNNNCIGNWQAFLNSVRLRFDPDHYVDYVGLLAKLSQRTTVLAYQTEFETLLNKVRGVPEASLISLFKSGLKQPIQREVNLRHPTTLSQAFALAREFATNFQELSQALAPARRTWTPPAPQPLSTFPQSATPKAQSLPSGVPSGLPLRRLTFAEREDRTRKGLCFNCDEKFQPGHRCKHRFLALLGTDDEETMDDFELSETPEEQLAVTADISSIHSLSSTNSPRALRLTGNINNVDVHVLIDGGSTHNFIHPHLAERLRLPLQSTSPFKVYVGNGDYLRCTYICKDTRLLIQENSFSVDLYVLPVHGPDVVLGVQWLQQWGRIVQNYAKLTIEFRMNGRWIKLQGEDNGPRPITLHTLHVLHSAKDLVGCYELIPAPARSADTSDVIFPPDLPSAISETLEEFRTVFGVPKGLPPARLFDHHIHLLPNTKPVNVRPYRYPHFQKSEIERQVREMLEQGHIRHSHSPFSSPVLLVKKKDGTFRFCVDYRALNAVTIADKFPIPTTDELFDELGKARFFTKLDLRSGYHQIRMHESDIYKTAFRTHEGHFEFLIMPFGLTNAPSTFQAAMNHIFRPYLRRFVIVFFDDILIYSASLATHIDHLRSTLTLLGQHHFFVKASKCSFSKPSVDYLGHVIVDGQLRADTSKVSAMTQWPTPSSVKQLRGFLGLTGYYRRFIRHYAHIAAPLTELLRKNAFAWSETANTAFETLKRAMVEAPVLSLPDFAKDFVVETDACESGIGAVLMQDMHPIAYFSKKLGPRRRVASTYHKELYAIVEAVQKWRQYLLGREFIIRSDQKSLKELLCQVIQTPDQQFYIRKLMGFQFRIEYKKGIHNRVADALSRKDNDVDLSMLFSTYAQPLPTLLDKVRHENATEPDLVAFHDSANAGTLSEPFRVFDGVVYYGHRLCISRTSQLKNEILKEFHASLSAGHAGIDHTFRRLATVFYWPNMRTDVRNFVRACHVCQVTKYSTQKPGGLLQPLPIPARVWDAVTMDFITGLPASKGFTSILVVVDRLTKYSHFGPLPTSYDAPKVAGLFVDIVVKLHGFPQEIISDRDVIFMSVFWKELFQLSGTTLKRSTAYHPQTDGQTEVINRGLEQYLRAFTHERPTRWAILLPWAELALNTSFHEGLGMTPFEALYGRPPPNLCPYEAGVTRVAAVDVILRERHRLLQSLRQNLVKAQARMKARADLHRREEEFTIGDLVLLKMRPYRQHSVSRPLSNKLARRFYGPFEIIERIGDVAYRLQLPETAKIHNVFHVSLLRRYQQATDSVPPACLPDDFVDGQPTAVPERALGERTVLINGHPVQQWLIRWSDHIGEDDTWEPRDEMILRFPNLRLEDKSNFEPGESVTDQPEEPALGRGKRKKFKTRKLGY